MKRISGRSLLACGLLVATAISCGEAPAPVTPLGAESGGFEGIGTINAPLLVGTCSTTNHVVTVQVAGLETLYATYRPTDGKVVINANFANNGGPCEFANSGNTLAVTAKDTTAHTVILDYVNGAFLLGASGTAPGITIDLTSTGGTSNTIKIRGSNGVDKYSVGNTTTAGLYDFNVNTGSATGLDAFADFTFKNVQTLIVSTGPGDDVIDGSGTTANGVGTAYTLPLQVFGGPGADTITGGAGDDVIYGGVGNDTMDGSAGNNTYNMSTAADGADTVAVTGTATRTDTVDYRGRTNNLTLNIDNTATSGETSENDKISDKVTTVLGGAGDDTVVVATASTSNHIVKGGPGNDSMTGGKGLDTFDGQAGDDTFIGGNCIADYSSRTVAITATVCNPTGVCTSNNVSGDQSTTYAENSGTGAILGADSGNHHVTVTGLAHMTAASFSKSRKLIISGSTLGFDGGGATPLNDGTYPILSYVSASSVTIDVSSNTNFVGGESGLDYAEQGAEADNVQCIFVKGGTANDTITGDDRNNRLEGNDGNDTLVGGTGDDTLLGGKGTDTLYGGVGADTLDGGPDNDTLVGGDDNDVLIGNGGTNAFTCNGKNDATTNGSAPGDSDFTVDFLSGTDTNAAADCAF